MQLILNPSVLNRSLGAGGRVDAVDVSDLLTLLVVLGVLTLLGVAVIPSPHP